MAFELQPSLTSTSGSCFVKTAAKNLLVDVSHGNLIPLNVLSSKSYVFDHSIVADTSVLQNPFFVSTDNKRFGLVGNKFVQKDSNATDWEEFHTDCFSMAPHNLSCKRASFLFSAAMVSVSFGLDNRLLLFFLTLLQK